MAYKHDPFGYKKIKVHLGAMEAVGGGLAAAGSIYSSIAQQRSAAQALTLAYQQHQLQKRIAEKQMEMAQAGTQDARGNKNYYVPGVGWISAPTAQTKALLNASDREEMNRLTTDAMRTRRGKVANEDVRGRERLLADTYFRQMQDGVGETSPEAMEGQIGSVLLSDVNDKADFAKNAIAAQSMRSGTPNKQADNINKIAQSGVNSALAKARFDAPVEANRRNSELRSANMNRYNALASRAGNVEDAAFQPTGVANVPEASMAKSMTMGPYGLAGASTAAGKGFDSLMTGMTAQRKGAMDYGLAGAGINELIEKILRGQGGSSGSRPGSKSAAGGGDDFF